MSTKEKIIITLLTFSFFIIYGLAGQSDRSTECIGVDNQGEPFNKCKK